ncbi:hypothetical protein ACFCZ1_04280 [Streptomyces sp. NPDC056224]
MDFSIGDVVEFLRRLARKGDWPPIMWHGGRPTMWAKAPDGAA